MSRSKIKVSKDELKSLYFDKKLSIDQIAKKFCCSERTIFARLYEYNIPIRYDNRRTDITKDKLEELYINKKLSIDKIAKIFRCGKNTIWVRLGQYNIKIRTKSEANKGKYRIKMLGQLESLYKNKKLSTSEIAEKFSCSTCTIVRRLHNYDIPIRGLRINISKENLESLYVKKEMNIYQIAKKLNCSGITILNRLNYYNISTRKRGKFREGKYEVEIPKGKIRHLYINKGLTISEISKIFDCSRTTLYKRLYKYNIPVRNVSEALKGNPSPMKGKHHTAETRRKLSRATVRQLASGRMKRRDTSIELKMERELKRINICYQKQVPLCDITVVDFYLPEYKIVIYADGDYWHNIPEVRDRDKRQNRILEDKGYRVLRFWGREINKSIEECGNRIKQCI